MARMGACCLLVAGLVLTVGCPGIIPPDDNGGTGGSGGDAMAGSTLFAANCAGCHGADASGNIGPNIQGEEVAEITEHVINGHEGHTTFDFTEQDIPDIAAYLATL